MTSSESKEPKGSERSSNKCRCGHSGAWHPFSNGGACTADGCRCAGLVCDHTRCGWKPREEPEECNCDPVRELDGYTYKSAYLHAAGCPKGQQPEEAHDFSSPSHCAACAKTWVGRGVAAMEDEEPPLTPEEEEEADCPHESWEVRSQWRDAETGKWWKSRRCADCREYLDNVLDDEEHDFEGPTEPPPPQPERRPPYVVAYSVQGHLYEVALSGDATVRAVDGALVIQHHLGPVAGIVSVLPVINKESNAQADH